MDERVGAVVKEPFRPARVSFRLRRVSVAADGFGPPAAAVGLRPMLIGLQYQHAGSVAGAGEVGLGRANAEKHRRARAGLVDRLLSIKSGCHNVKLDVALSSRNCCSIKSLQYTPTCCLAILR